MSTVDSIFSIVILHICMSLFESTMISLCTPLSKLDLHTLRKGSRERKSATEQIKSMMKYEKYPSEFIFLICSVAFFFLCCPGEALEGPIWNGFLQKLNNVVSNNGIQI